MRYLGIGLCVCLLLLSGGCGKKTGSSKKASGCKLGELEKCQQQCDAGKLPACLMVGRCYQMGEGAKFDSDKAMAAFVKACDKGHPPACVALGGMYENEFFKKRYNKSKATALYKKTCDAGYPPGCIQYAWKLWPRGKDKGADPKEARSIFEGQCKKGYKPACVHVSWMYRTGQGYKKDEPKGVKMLQDLCGEGVQPACTALADVTANGWGVKKDLAKALQLRKQACANGDMEGCTAAGRQLTDEEEAPGGKPDHKQGLEYYKKACDCFEGCLYVGLLYDGGEKGVQADSKLAFRYYYKGCMLGSSTSCKSAGKLLRQMIKK